MVEFEKLRAFEIRGFKSIRDQRVDIGDINIVIGPNGAGKSNLIEAFQCLRSVIFDLKEYVTRRGGADAMVFKGTKTTKEVFLALDASPYGYSCRLVPDTSDLLRIEGETVKTPNESHEVSPGGYRSILQTKITAALSTELFEKTDFDFGVHILFWTAFHFQYTGPDAAIQKMQHVHDEGLLHSDGGNLAPFLFSIKKHEPASYGRIVQTIRRVAPFFKDFILEPEKHNPKKILLRWRHEGIERPFFASEFPDGLQRFVCLATVLLQPDPPKVILIDEPELGLHPFAIHLLGGLIRKAATKCQVIAATQSVTLANQFSYEDIIVADREDEESVFSRLSQEEVSQWLEEYGIGDLWEKNLLGGTPK